MKCGQYWPLETGRTEEYGYFLVRNVYIEMFQDFTLSHLELYNSQVCISLFLCHGLILMSLLPVLSLNPTFSWLAKVSMCRPIKDKNCFS